MIQRRILTAIAVVVVALSSLLGGNVFAAQTSTVGGNALKIAPVRQDLTMDPGTSKTLDVYISNLTNIPATLHGAINDFVANTDESGTPNIILDENKSAPTHSIKQYVTPLGNFTVAPQTQKDVKVVITIPKNAAGGGYFGAVRFYPPPAPGDKQLNLSASVGSLLLLKVNGAITEKMNVVSFDVRRGENTATFFTSNKKLVNVVRFQNTGNVQLEPFGTAQLKRFGKVVATYQINNTDPRGNVLPDSIRRFQNNVTKVNSFGKFTLVGNFGYGSTGQLLTASVTFYVVPVPLILLGVGILLVLLFLIFVLPRMIRSYNRRVIRRASRRR